MVDTLDTDRQYLPLPDVQIDTGPLVDPRAWIHNALASAPISHTHPAIKAAAELANAYADYYV